MGGKAEAPPPPDYTPLAEASREAAQISAQVARENLAWARERYDLDRDLTDLIVETALDRMDREDQAAAADRERYQVLFQPLEEDLIEDAESYATPERIEFEAGRAMSDVSQQFELARAAAQDRLESFGIDPSQTRAQALDLGTRVQEAAARASAGNNARQMTEGMGRALRSEAINVGRGYPGQIASAYNTAIQSGNQAVNSQLATTSTASNAMGNPVQWQGAANQAIGTWWNGLNNMYETQVKAFQAENQANSGSGLGSALGLIGGLAGRAFMASDENVKKDVTPVGKLDDGQTVYRYRYEGSPTYQIGLLAQDVEKRAPHAVADMGGVKGVDYKAATENAVHAEGGGAIPTPGHGGVRVPERASPSGGAIPDDVPARLTPGEFVVPKDVVRQKGEEFFQKLIANTRKTAQDAPARPEVRRAPAAAPAIDTTSRPAPRRALPVG